jgi:hypothetical protein
MNGRNTVTKMKGVTVTRRSIREYLVAQRVRYQRARRPDRGTLLDEIVAVTGYHRKGVIRHLRQSRPPRPGARPVGRPRRYGPAIAAAATVLWEAAGQIDAKRLQPFVGELLDRLRAWGELHVAPPTAVLLRQASGATLERLLASARRTRPRRGLSPTRPGSWLKAHIPIRTFAEWSDAQPGFLEVDLVAHCGPSSDGFFLYTLCAVAVATGWVELQPVWGKGHSRVKAALHEIRHRLPVPLRGLDPDNGGEFINRPLYSYCFREGITFTRSRVYRKNDSAHVEQKNGAVVRAWIGHDRYASRAASAQLTRVAGLLRAHVNFFQPVQRLLHKSRHGARVRRVYDRARTPYQRLVASGALTPTAHHQLAAEYAALNPLRLRRDLDAPLATLWRLTTPQAPPSTATLRLRAAALCR